MKFAYTQKEAWEDEDKSLQCLINPFFYLSIQNLHIFETINDLLFCHLFVELLYDIDIRHISVADSPWPAYKLRKLQNLKIFFFFVFFVYHLLGIEHI